MKVRRLVISPQAHRDFASILSWYREEFGGRTAAKTGRTIQAGYRAATRISLAAARRDDLPEGYFRVVAKVHLVIFTVVSDEARIVRVVHAARDLPALLPEL